MVDVNKIVKSLKKSIDYSSEAKEYSKSANDYYIRWFSEFSEQTAIIIVGCGKNGRILSSIFQANNDLNKVKCFVDNDIRCQGKMIDGLAVLSLSEAQRQFPNSYYVITAMKYENELMRQLLNEGIGIEKICVFIPQYAGII